MSILVFSRRSSSGELESRTASGQSQPSSNIPSNSSPFQNLANQPRDSMDSADLVVTFSFLIFYSMSNILDVIWPLYTWSSHQYFIFYSLPEKSLHLELWTNLLFICNLLWFYWSQTQINNKCYQVPVIALLITRCLSFYQHPIITQTQSNLLFGIFYQFSYLFFDYAVISRLDWRVKFQIAGSSSRNSQHRFSEFRA